VKKTILLVALFSLWGCSSATVTPTSYYLLRPDIPAVSRTLEPSTDYVLGTVSIATYIDQPGLVLETNSGEIHAARQHQWAEPLRASLRRFLASEISSAAGQDILMDTNVDGAVRIDIAIDQLHGTADGEARLMAYWRLQTEGGEDTFFQYAATRPLRTDGYAALAQAEKALLQSLAVDIARSLESGEPG
jgi:uncharacterized lipoprotein YmbA